MVEFLVCDLSERDKVVLLQAEDETTASKGVAVYYSMEGDKRWCRP
jgi:hypothetical protein